MNPSDQPTGVRCNNRACDNFLPPSHRRKLYCSPKCRFDCHNTPALRRMPTRAWSSAATECSNVRGDVTKFCTLNCDHGVELGELAFRRAELERVRDALSADNVLEMITRLSAAADWLDPADDYLLNAARVLADGMVP